MITVDLTKAKEITHNVRRVVRAELFKPLDIEATIPMYAQAAEEKRQAIRDQFADIQNRIDAADDAETLKQLIATCKEAK